MDQVSKRDLLSERIDSAIRFFLYLLFFWLPYSPAVVETCVIISLLLWITKRIFCQDPAAKFEGLSIWQKGVLFLKKFQVAPSYLNRAIAFFLIVCILSVISSSFFGVAAHNFFTKTLEWFIVYFLVIEVFQEKKHIFILLTVWVFTAFSTIFDGFLQFYFTNKDIFLGNIIEPGGRATAAFKTHNGLGAYLVIMIPFLLSLMFVSVKKNWYYLVGALAFCPSLKLISFS